MKDESSSSQKWDAQLRKGTLELAVFAAIGDTPKYGLELLNYFHRFETMQITEGTLYPLLDRLKRDGLIDADWIQEGETRPRKYYSLTQSGKEKLDLLAERWSRSVADLQAIISSSF